MKDDAKILIVDDANMLQKASSVCLCAVEMKKNNSLSLYNEVSPEYLRVSQAERLKNAK